MKTLLAIALLAAGSAHAAVPATILEAKMTPGFVMNPESRDFYVQDDGKMTLEITELRNGKKTVRDLGTLTEDAVRGLLDQVNQINPHAKLVDPKKSEPMCTDTPGFTTYAFVKGKRMEISRQGECHEWALDNGQGKDLTGFARLFLLL